MESSAANVKRLEDLQAFQKITAPFDGIITARNTDIGALIDAGGARRASSSAWPPSTSCGSSSRCPRPTPRPRGPAPRPRSPSRRRRARSTGARWPGPPTRSTPSPRTMLSEVEMENPTGEVLPGAYVVVRLRVGRATRGLTIPANTLLFRSEGLRVAVVRNGRAELVPVKIGRDYGRQRRGGGGPHADRRGDPRSRRLAGQRRPPSACARASRRSRRPAGSAGRAAAGAGPLACQRATSSQVVNHTPRARRMKVTRSSSRAMREARPLTNGWQVSTKQPFSAVHRRELLAPHLEHASRIRDRVGGAVDVAEERRVVEQPLHRHLGERPLGVGTSYGHVVAHQRAVVEEAVALEQARASTR